MNRVKEIELMEELIRRWEALPPVVDDDFPSAHHLVRGSIIRLAEHVTGRNLSSFSIHPHREIGQKCNVYVASSWRNKYQQDVVNVLREAGHEVYDFKNPKEGDKGFHWSQIDKDWEQWDIYDYGRALISELAEQGYYQDWDAMNWADTFVLVQPCGRSAHLELGWAVGAGKRTALYYPEQIEPELMVKMCDYMSDDLRKIIRWVNGESLIY